jgi:hypothetical protein
MTFTEKSAAYHADPNMFHGYDSVPSQILNCCDWIIPLNRRPGSSGNSMQLAINWDLNVQRQL